MAISQKHLALALEPDGARSCSSYETGPLTHRQLAELNQTTGPYVSLIVDKLEEHGLVQRGPHPDDGRRKLVSLTPSGLDAIATAEAILYRPPEAMTALPEEELKHLIDLAQRVSTPKIEPSVVTRK